MIACRPFFLRGRAEITSHILAGSFGRGRCCSLLTDPLAGYARRLRLAGGRNSCAIKYEFISARPLCNHLILRMTTTWPSATRECSTWNMPTDRHILRPIVCKPRIRFGSCQEITCTIRLFLLAAAQNRAGENGTRKQEVRAKTRRRE